MNILFLSQYYPDGIIDKCVSISKIGMDWAAHNLSKAIIQGFKENSINGKSINDNVHCANDFDFSVLNVPMIGSFPPFSKSPFAPSYSDKDVESIGYVNITYLKRLDIKRRLVKSIRKWARGHNGEKVLLMYNFLYLDVIVTLKKEFEDLKVVLLVTDLPEYMTPHETILTRLNNIISPLENNKKGERYDYVDGYILLAEGMRHRMPVGNKPWLLMEGIYNDECSMRQVGEKDAEKVIMYSGNLGTRYGIRLLLDAFSKINDKDYRLWIRGNGELENEIKELAQKDSRIVLLERMSREELTRHQKRATIVVNPVPASQEFTAYFFPSKTLEYMASGTPTLMFPLACLPQEYYRHLYFFDNESPESMAARIKEICEMPQEELNTFGMKASEFILLNKSPKAQVARIIEFINKISS